LDVGDCFHWISTFQIDLIGTGCGPAMNGSDDFSLDWVTGDFGEHQFGKTFGTIA
jgi:hypothetical protein